MRLFVYDMLVNVNVISYVHVCEQARWARSAGNSAIENVCIIFYTLKAETVKAIEQLQTGNWGPWPRWNTTRNLQGGWWGTYRAACQPVTALKDASIVHMSKNKGEKGHLRQPQSHLIQLTLTNRAKFLFWSSDSFFFIVALRPRKRDGLLGTGTEWEGDGTREWRLDRGNHPKKTGETVDRRQNNGSVKAVSPRHCPATCALRNCCFNCCAWAESQRQCPLHRCWRTTWTTRSKRRPTCSAQLHLPILMISSGLTWRSSSTSLL